MKTTLAYAISLAAMAAATPAHSQTSAETSADTVAEPHPMTAQDLVTTPRLGSPSVSPDGGMVVYSVTKTDPETYKRSSHKYLRSIAAMGEPLHLEALGEASSVRFGSDGALWYLAPDEAGITQVYRAALQKNRRLAEPRQVTSFAASVGGFVLAPDLSRIVVHGARARSCSAFDCDAGPKGGDPVGGDAVGGTGRLYESDGGFIRHWDAWETPGTYNRAFAYALDGGSITGAAIPLDGPAGSGALVGDTPTAPFGGDEDIAIAPDGSAAYITARVADANEPYSTNLDIYRTDLSTGAVTNLTADNAATDALPMPSPDGRYLAYVAMARPGYESDRMVVQLRDLASGTTRALTQDFDRSFSSLAWTPDSRTLLATAQSVLDTPAYAIDVVTGSIRELDLMPGNEAHIGNVAALPDGNILFTRDSIGAPSELYLSVDAGQAMPLTDVASSLMGRQRSVVTTRFSFAGADGDTVYGQITKPERHAGKLPAILYVHGGPQGSFNDGWSSRWNPRVLASQGYAVVSVDFHGSTGYGQDFADSINGDWGGKPLEDLQLGLAAALAKDSQIDGTRACAMGASYGGYMMNWIAGNWPDRFKCLVQHDGLFDLRMFYYTTEELWFPRWDFGGSYADNPDAYEKWNPVDHVDKWQTPMLVVAGEQDFRIPYTQGIASFTALQERNIPGQLLVFPDENHWVLGPKNSLQWHETVFSWLDRWLKQEDAGK
ncbi:Acylaminoacyl-peptidase [Alteripontixanthobacter maritimus]|uniref:Acylaminoacyl-peptidase n=1 Tax=Alteripontixanthobacter maritimus TaxID=2161824 RepID=A0A369QFU4_9SPHN|nr:S9 family peptidase [Alteripontixanthobacter maritimus]RDC61168.1 Acylaminoacyl-peptidase [Alteripontixanthobacter maritimus]